MLRHPAGQTVVSDAQPAIAHHAFAESVLRAAIKFLPAGIHQKDGAIGGSEIIAHDQQDLVQHRIHVHAGEDHLGGFLQHGHFTDAGMDVFQWGISHGAASAVANTNSVIACL